MPPCDHQLIGTIDFDLRISIVCGSRIIAAASASALGHLGSPMSGPSKPRMGFFPLMGSDFETFLRRGLIVGVRFLASLTFFRLVKTSTAHQKQ